MKYFDLFKTNSPIIKAQNGVKFSYDPNDSDSVREFQRQAIELGYLSPKLKNGKDADDGVDGPATRLALAEMNRNGGIRKLSTEQAQNVYINRSGLNNGYVSAAGDMLSHIFMPESWNLGTNTSSQKQVAAIIAEKGIPKSGKGIITYDDYGRMLGTSGNVNKQGTSNNAAGKTVGMATYRLSDDGKSIIVNDTYDFNIERVPIRDASGNIVKWEIKKTDEYQNSDKGGWGSALSGLWDDVVNNGMLSNNYKDSKGNSVSFWTRLQHLAENFGTRQGKTRDSSFVIPVDTFNRWTEQ